MSEFTDDTLGRYLDQQHDGMRQTRLNDALQQMQTETMRCLLDAAERAMSAEDVPDGVRRRVVNRIVWGDPEGREDVYAARHRQMIAVLGGLTPVLPPELAPEV